MADFPVTEPATRQPETMVRDMVLSAGQTLTGDIMGFNDFCTLTVPAGKWASVRVRLNVMILDEDPNA